MYLFLHVFFPWIGLQYLCSFIKGESIICSCKASPFGVRAGAAEAGQQRLTGAATRVFERTPVGGGKAAACGAVARLQIRPGSGCSG